MQNIKSNLCGCSVTSPWGGCCKVTVGKLWKVAENLKVAYSLTPPLGFTKPTWWVNKLTGVGLLWPNRGFKFLTGMFAIYFVVCFKCAFQEIFGEYSPTTLTFFNIVISTAALGGKKEQNVMILKLRRRQILSGEILSFIFACYLLFFVI